ncbi:MAG: hypothetical protein NT023_06870, partial [Armatimonadetes bacterium]|nr:hypothetical protein [Armatimonadota bacterium]
MSLTAQVMVPLIEAIVTVLKPLIKFHVQDSGCAETECPTVIEWSVSNGTPILLYHVVMDVGAVILADPVCRETDANTAPPYQYECNCKCESNPIQMLPLIFSLKGWICGSVL